ncbi:MAG: hypothetical protein GEV07_21465 [Streptosporangiales bacterium]|nr:hypothetical protein [Streptosporangiales bacterium]
MAFTRRHWIFLAVALGGSVLRVLVQVAYEPAILYIDSFSYLATAADSDPDPSRARPIGYSALLLGWLLPLRDLSLITTVQHLLGVAMGALIYALLLRRQAPRWLATLAAAPILLDGYQLQIEQNIMTDTLFQALVLAAFATLLWRREPHPTAAAAVGLLLGLAVTVRPVGLLLIGVVLGYALLVGQDLRRRLTTAGAVVATFALPLVVYGAWYLTAAGGPEPNPYQGKVLYGRVAPFADCTQLAGEPRRIRELCPSEPPEHRRGEDHYIHADSSPANQTGLTGAAANAALRTFARTVIVNQPVAFAQAVTVDFAKGFAPVRTTAPGDVPLERWRFQLRYPVYAQGNPYHAAAHYDSEQPRVNTALGGFLRDYQAVMYTRGPLLAVAAGCGLLAGLVRRRAVRSPAALAVTVAGLGLILTPAFVEFSWRYQLPAIVLLPLGGALGVTSWLTARRQR